MMYLLDVPPSTTQFYLTFKVAFDPTEKTAKKQQNHLDFSRAPKEAWTQPKKSEKQDWKELSSLQYVVFLAVL